MHHNSDRDVNKRAFTRVQARICFGCTPLEGLPRHWEKTARLHLSRGAAELPVTTDFTDFADMFRLLHAALTEVKEDLRRIKAHLGIEEIHLRRREVEISGSGLSFQGPEEFSPGQLLMLSMVLPFELPVLVRAVGELIEGRESAGAQGRLNRLRFVVIHEEDRELIVKYTFQRQRELINISRSRRKENGED